VEWLQRLPDRLPKQSTNDNKVNGLHFTLWLQLWLQLTQNLAAILLDEFFSARKGKLELVTRADVFEL